jgi:hypothetical protein
MYSMENFSSPATAVYWREIIAASQTYVSSTHISY